jgi:CheY-like chemotaxis protein
MLVKTKGLNELTRIATRRLGWSVEVLAVGRKFHFEVVPLSEVPSGNCETDRRGILVVDDEPLVADTLAMILSQAGFEARAVYDGTSALQAARERQPGFLLTDVWMPGMDGIELAMHVADEFPACEILLFSGNATGADLEGARRAGYEFRLMQKPIRPEHLVSYITSCFDGERNPGDGAELVEAPLWGAMYSRAS